MARQIHSWLKKGTQKQDYGTGNLKEWGMRVEVWMKAEKNSSKEKTKPSGKGKLGKSLGTEETRKKKARKEKRTNRTGIPAGWKTSLEGQVP